MRGAFDRRVRRVPWQELVEGGERRVLKGGDSSPIYYEGDRAMRRYLAVTLILVLPALMATGCGGNGNDAGGNNTGEDTTVAPAGGDPFAGDWSGDEDLSTESAVEEPADDLSGTSDESASSDGPSLEITIPGDDAATANGDGSGSDGNKSVTEAIFNSILRGAQSGPDE